MEEQDTKMKMVMIADYLHDNVGENSAFLVIMATEITADAVSFEVISNVPPDGQEVILRKALDNIEAKKAKKDNVIN